MDIKWAILLDPETSSTDPRFSDVARWGHGTAIMADGGRLIADDTGIRVPKGNAGSEMAGRLAVLEAVDRGWTSIDISGPEDFVKGAREAARLAGLGTKITTRTGALHKSKPEYIMARPPSGLAGMTTEDQAQKASDDLLGGGDHENPKIRKRREP